MAYHIGRKIASSAASWAISLTAFAAIAQAASPVTVADTRVFPESISATSDGTLLIAGSEKGIIYKAAPGGTIAQAWISREQAGFEGFLLGIYADDRADDALIDDLAREAIAYVPFFPLGGFTPLQSSTLSSVAVRLGATPMKVALAWTLRRAPNILLIPGTSSVAHLHENLAAAELDLPDHAVAALDGIAASAAM
jgi:hypothetical protein